MGGTAHQWVLALSMLVTWYWVMRAILKMHVGGSDDAVR